MDGTLAILGTGHMGEALLGGLLRSGWARPDQLWCTVRDPERARVLAETYGVRADTDSPGATAAADVLVLATKPQNLRDLLVDIAPRVTVRHTIVSVAAGITTAAIAELVPTGTPIVRVMPNVPVQVDEAMSAIAPGRAAGDEHVRLAEEILGHVGRVVHVEERDLDAVTAVSGSGPAYVFLLAEAMIDAGIAVGLPREVATELVIQTVVGSATMLRDTGRRPAELREAVSSPGGTTLAALHVLEQRGLRAAVLDAVEAARARSAELAGG
ncbi:MAG: pyrroline-5-carboxylate reductase [Egibacteraceae bacterium]